MKKAISILLAVLIVSALIPGALATGSGARPVATEDSLPVMTEVANVPLANTRSISVTSDDIVGTGTANDHYVVYTTAGFESILSNFNSTTLSYTYIDIVGDIYLGELSNPNTWEGYIKYFYGEINGIPNSEGELPTIHGIADDCYLIYAWFGGKISNLQFDMQGKRGTIVYVCGRAGTSYRTFEMNTIKVVSDTPIVLPSANQANYSPFLYTMCGTFSMINCVNEAQINGATYAGVFCGYYPLDTTGTYVFDGCVNKAPINLQHAGFFYGNNTAFVGSNRDSFSIGTGRITINNCRNENTLRGTSTVKYFTAEPAEYNDNSVVDAYETFLTTISEDNSNTMPLDLKVNEPALTGFDVTVNDNNEIIITQPTDTSNITKYVVTVATYAFIYELVDGNFIYNGNTRFWYEEEIQASQFPSNGIATLKNYGFTNDSTATAVSYEFNHFVYQHGNKYYYGVTSSELSAAQSSISSNCIITFTGGSELPYEDVTAGYREPYIVSVSAYNGSTLLDSVIVD